MPLSEHEQRLLEQIEQNLYADDPKFASTVRSTDIRVHTRRRLIRASVLLVLGFVVMVVGIFNELALALGGFVLMLLAAVYGLAAWRRTSARPSRPRSEQRGGRASRPAGGEQGGPFGRLEERWKRRWEERGGEG